MSDQDPGLSPNEERAVDESQRQDDAQGPGASQYRGLLFLVPILVALALVVAWRTSPAFRLLVGLFVGGSVVVVVALAMFWQSGRDAGR